MYLQNYIHTFQLVFLFIETRVVMFLSHSLVIHVICICFIILIMFSFSCAFLAVYIVLSRKETFIFFIYTYMLGIIII